MKNTTRYDQPSKDELLLSRQEVAKRHLDFFRQELIKNGASPKITDDQVRTSCGFASSLDSFSAGWDALALKLGGQIVGMICLNSKS